ncbi:MAG: helix-turn-helix domain-containing protein [Thermoguttaceae bacterium]
MRYTKHIQGKELISQAEACKLLGVSLPTLIKARNAGEVPFVAVGRRKLYNRFALAALGQTSYRPSAQEVANTNMERSS